MLHSCFISSFQSDRIEKHSERKILLQGLSNLDQLQNIMGNSFCFNSDPPVGFIKVMYVFCTTLLKHERKLCRAKSKNPECDHVLFMHHKDQKLTSAVLSSAKLETGPEMKLIRGVSRILKCCVVRNCSCHMWLFDPSADAPWSFEQN